MLKLQRYVGLYALFALLYACDGANLDQLQQYIDAKEAEFNKHALNLEPVPTIPASSQFTFVASERRDPFTLPKHAKEAGGDGDIRPDLKRPREELESFPLDSLRMVGTLDRDQVKWGLVQTREGAVYRVTTGNFLGQNFGKILRVGDNEIELMEIISDGADGWLDRRASLALAGN